MPYEQKWREHLLKKHAKSHEFVKPHYFTNTAQPGSAEIQKMPKAKCISSHRSTVVQKYQH
jgi:hypothetical protein